MLCCPAAAPQAVHFELSGLDAESGVLFDKSQEDLLTEIDPQAMSRKGLRSLRWQSARDFSLRPTLWLTAIEKKQKGVRGTKSPGGSGQSPASVIASYSVVLTVIVTLSWY